MTQNATLTNQISFVSFGYGLNFKEGSKDLKTPFYDSSHIPLNGMNIEELNAQSLRS